MSKQLKDMTFEELADEMTRNILSSLLKGGGTAMHSAVWMALQSAIMWRQEQDANVKRKPKE